MTNFPFGTPGTPAVSVELEPDGVCHVGGMAQYTPVAGGSKHDQGKYPMELLDRIWLEQTAAVLAFGATKYARHNWRKGLQGSRLIGAALRHIVAFNDGEDNDPESGLPHLAHASCCLMFALRLHRDRPDLDDRHKVGG